MDPFSLVGMGIGTLGSLAGGIQSAIEAPKKKRQFLADAQKDAQIEALRNSRWTQQSTHPTWDQWFTPNAVDAKIKKDRTRRYADENFDFDPMSLLPFVQSGTQFAGGLYDYMNEPQPEAPKPESLQYYENWRPNQAPAHMTPANPEPYRKKWHEL